MPINIFKKKHKRKRIGSARVYIMIASILFIVLIASFISPYFGAQTYAYDRTELSVYQSMGSKVSVALVSYEFNSGKGLLRCDLALSSGGATVNLANTEYQINAKYAGNTDLLETSVYRVNDNYLVAYISGLPRGFNLMAINITGSLIYPELESSDYLKDTQLRMYVYENDVPVNETLSVSTESELLVDYVTYQQDLLREEVQETQHTIDTKLLAISQIRELITALEDEMSFQTEDEIQASNNQIATHQTQIESYKKEIETLTDSITQLEEKIALLEEKKDQL